MPGQFIVLEGPDGAGTTRHSQLLAEYLESRGRKVVLTAEPTEGDVGKFIRGELRSHGHLHAATLQLLFCADRAEHLQTVVEPALKAGKTVVCDRYTTSTLVYGEALRLDPAWLATVNEPFRHPDLLFFLLPGFDVCLSRIKRRSQRDILEDEKLQRKIYGLYAGIAQEDHSIVSVDTSVAIEDAAKRIAQAAR